MTAIACADPQWRQANSLSLSTRERNEIQNEVIRAAGIQMK